MNLGDVDLNLLGAFEALFIERSVTRASRRLGLGQPATSDALRRLRALFGDELFVRASGEMLPTPRARQIAEHVIPLLSRLRAVMGDHVGFAPRASSKVFTIASTDFTTLVLLPGLTEALRREAPNVDLRVMGYDKAGIGSLLDRGEADVAIGVFPSPPPNMIKSRLFDDRFVGLVRTDHPALRNGGLDLRTFAELPHALVSVSRDEVGLVDRELGKMGLRRRVALVVPYMLLLPKALAVSDLVATVPERAARIIAGPDLHCFELPFATDPWSVEMLWNPVARSDQATAWLRSLIVTTAKEA